MHKGFAALFCFVASVAQAQDCSWMSVDRIDKAFQSRAAWSTMAADAGRCKFISTQAVPPSTISVTQIVKGSAEEAEKYARSVGSGMAASYRVTPLTAIGAAGAAVREKTNDGRMLTLVGHQKNIVVMIQMSFPGGVSPADESAAVAIAQETFGLDTGGGLKMPSR